MTAAKNIIIIVIMAVIVIAVITVGIRMVIKGVRDMKKKQ